jgi:predicted nucleic acid-binding protein
MYLVDTCVLSEARRGTPKAVAWLSQAPGEAVFLSVITVGEIMKGIVMKARIDPAAAASLQRWLDEMRLRYRAQILPVDDAVGVAWGRLIGQKPRPIADALIAATARVNNKVLVTRNVADFADMGVDLLNPWDL